MSDKLIEEMNVLAGVTGNKDAEAIEVCTKVNFNEVVKAFRSEEDIPSPALDALVCQPELRAAGGVSSTRYLTEAYHLEKRWDSTGLLGGVKDKYLKSATAVVLENQRLMNEQSSDTGDIAQFKRVSIPMVRRIMGGLTIHKFVSIQPMLGPVSLFYYLKEDDKKLRIESSELASITRKLKAVWSYEACCDLRASHSLDQEAELTAILAQEVKLEYEMEVLKDLRDGAGLQKRVHFDYVKGDTLEDKYARIREMIVALARENADLYGTENRPRMPNWMIMGSSMANALFPTTQENRSFDIKKHCEMNTEFGIIDVYDHIMLAPDEIVLGYKGESYMDSGYVWAPYVMLTQTPVVLDPDTFMPRKGLISRYGRKMVNPTHYSVLKVKNFKLPEKKEDENSSL